MNVVQNVDFLILKCSPIPFSSLRTHGHILKNFILRFFSKSITIFHIQTTQKLGLLIILIIYFLDRIRDDKDVLTE
jgi:hypothetical protein